MTAWEKVLKLINASGGSFARVGNTIYIGVNDTPIGDFKINEDKSIDAQEINKVVDAFESIGYDREAVVAILGISGDPAKNQLVESILSNYQRIDPETAREITDIEVIRGAGGDIESIRIGRNTYHRLLKLYTPIIRELGFPASKHPVIKAISDAVKERSGPFASVDYDTKLIKAPGLRGRYGENFVTGDIGAFKRAIRDLAERYIGTPVEERAVEVKEGQPILDALRLLLDEGIMQSSGAINIRKLIEKLEG